MRVAYLIRLNMCIVVEIVVVVQVVLLFGCCVYTTCCAYRCSTVTTIIVWECCAVYKGTVTTVQMGDREPWYAVSSKWYDDQPASEVCRWHLVCSSHMTGV